MEFLLETGSGIDGIEETVFAPGEFDEGLNVFGASAAATRIFEAELGFDLARHDDPRTSCITNIRIGDPLAQAQIHGCLPSLTIMRSILSIARNEGSVNSR
ncbi:MAG TPA: hypothetical protein VJR03_15585 [Nitrospira sp.]|nr:hypothetical protein [Nitrospira sp.]